MTVAKSERKAMSPEAFVEELERIRTEFLDGASPWGRGRRRGKQTKEEIAAGKRKGHVGGDGNHRFEGERYLNAQDRTIRRKQLRKLVDEGGQISVGGPLPGHPTLSKWHSHEFGLTEEERARHLNALSITQEYLTTGKQCLENKNTLELLAEDLRMAQESLGTITGSFVADDLLGEIFSKFCIGK